MGRHVGGDLVVGPIPGTVQQQAGAAVVYQAEGLRVAWRVLIHAVHPGAVPHAAGHPREGHLWRAMPVEAIHVERAAGRCRYHLHAHRGDGIAADVRHRPRQHGAVARFDGGGGIAQRDELVFGVEDPDADGGFHGFVRALGQFHRGLHRLPGGEGGAGHQAVATALEVFGGVQRIDERRRGGAGGLAGFDAVEVQRQTAFAAGVRAVVHHALVAGEALHRAGHREVVAGAGLRRVEAAAGQRVAHAGDAHRLGDGIAHAAAAVRARQIADVRHRAAPIRPGIDALEPVLDAEQTAEVAGVAVRIPARGVDDLERLLEVVVAVQQGVNDQAVVGHHVAVATVLVIAVVGLDLAEGGPPVVAVGGVPAADVRDHPRQHAVGGDLGDAHVDQLVGIRLQEGRCFHRSQHLGAVDGLAVVGDAGGALR